ncbi:MAG: hypothetical protein E7057_10380 [Lentisphaerae bacterium]|nr:hypothetical protein [Lentisphaerota bacterium]
MEMLAKYIRMRTARSAATASHPCVEHATEGIKKKNPVDVTPLSFLPSFFSKAFFALHYGQSRALRASLAQSHT